MVVQGLNTYVSRSTVRSKILEHLFQKGPTTPTELASIDSEHLSHVSRALSELKAQGLVRPIALPTSRQKYYETTRKGIELYSSISRLPK